MIVCSSENIWYVKKNRKHKKKFVRFLIFLAVFTGIVIYERYIVAVNITRICSDYAYSYATESVNEAILNSLADSVKYSELVKIEKDDYGQIVLMTTDSFKVNYVNREIVKHTEIFLKEKLKKGIPVPILAFTGLEFLSGYGFSVYYKTLSITSVESDFSSEFESVGINQTLHSIYINVKSIIKIHFPLYEQVKELTTKILVSEAILVGKVPEVYLGGSLFG